MTTMDSSSLQGTDETPNSSGSATGSDQQGSGTVSITKEDFDSLKAEIETLKRSAQGDKDRAVKRTNERLEKLEGDVKPLLERAAELMAKGKSASEAMAQVNSEQEEIEDRQVMKEFVGFIKDGKLPTANVSGNTQANGVNVTDVIKSYGLDGNDPEVIAEVVGKTFASETEAKLAAANIALRRAKPTPATAAASTSITGAVPQQSQDSDAKVARLAALQKEPTKNKAEIRKLEAELGWA